MIYGLQAQGARPIPPAKRSPLPTEIVIPLGGEAAVGEPLRHDGRRHPRFVTTVYPVPPVPPVDATLLKTTDIAEASGAAHRAGANDTYSGEVLELGAGGEACAIRYEVAVPTPASTWSASPATRARRWRASSSAIDGQQAERENYPFIQMARASRRLPYSPRGLAWRPGWRISLSQGSHNLLLRRPPGAKISLLVLDAICLQPSRQ